MSKGGPCGRLSRFGGRFGPVLLTAALSLLASLALAGRPGLDPEAASDARTQPQSPATAALGAPAPHAGPIVLVTFSNLRSDALGFLGGPVPTPNFDALARRAEVAGSAVAPSSSPPVSAASLILGTRPWQHQLLSHLTGTLRDDLPTLGSALGELGYHSIIHYPVRQRMHVWGFFRGFDEAADLDADLDAVTEELRLLDGSRRLVWIHLRTTDLPWTDRRGGPPILLDDLYPYADPELDLPTTLRNRARRLYLDAVRSADRDLGRILEALDASGRRSETLLAVTALHGLEFGEHGQTLYGHNLGRESIQVPLLVDLPGAWSTVPLAGPARKPAPDASFGRAPPVELIRLWTTLVQVAGGERLPIHPPSLFEPAAGPALSALYMANGVNLHTAIFEAGSSGDPGKVQVEQVRVVSRYAPDDPHYYLALLRQAGLETPDFGDSPRRLFDRIRRGFVNSPPWSTFHADTGEPTVSWRLERWRPVRGTEEVDDEEAARSRAAEAYAAWSRWVGPEESSREMR